MPQTNKRLKQEEQYSDVVLNLLETIKNYTGTGTIEISPEETTFLEFEESLALMHAIDANPRIVTVSFGNLLIPKNATDLVLDIFLKSDHVFEVGIGENNIWHESQRKVAEAFESLQEQTQAHNARQNKMAEQNALVLYKKMRETSVTEINSEQQEKLVSRMTEIFTPRSKLFI